MKQNENEAQMQISVVENGERSGRRLSRMMTS